MKQHNTSDTRYLLDMIYEGHVPENSISECDAVIQIVFNDIEDYLRVRKDPHFVSVVNPDHANFADSTRTRFSTGWFEVHVQDGRVVS